MLNIDNFLPHLLAKKNADMTVKASAKQKAKKMKSSDFAKKHFACYLK